MTLLRRSHRRPTQIEVLAATGPNAFFAKLLRGTLRFHSALREIRPVALVKELVRVVGLSKRK